MALDEFDILKSQYSENKGDNLRPALVDKFGPVPGARSIFNPFNIFRYSRFGLNPGDYKIELHSDRTEITNQLGISLAGVSSTNVSIANAGGADPLTEGADRLQRITDSFAKLDVRRIIENPTASQLVDWSKLKSQPGEITADGPVPYGTTDFLWCKWYGRVPNNRLITLRRYPIPIEDNLNIAASKMPLVPMAQAVTWFGKETGNALNTILKPSWGLNWTEKSVADIQDIQGNEISVEDLLAATGQSDLRPEVVSTIKALITGDGKVDIAKLSGFDATIQEYVKNAYGANGPYWNRILGPVNVINKTKIRDRGMKDWTTGTITLKFTYSLRSWGGINPKIAFLDLLGNFLSLTYNTAPFWGGGARYFERTGVTLPSLGMEKKFFEGDIFGGIQVGMRELMNLATTRFNTIVAAAEDLVNRKKESKTGADFTSDEPEGYKVKKNLDENAVISTIEKAFIPRLALLMQKPLLFRSILDGRAIGEWHMVIGNPMNPIANIGNLVCTGCDYELNDVLGIDDFPTEVTFTITLQHARSRAKQDVESMFNLGNGAMTFSELPFPSSASNSLGENNTARSNAAFNGTSPQAELQKVSGGNDENASFDGGTIIGRDQQQFTTQNGNVATYGATSNGQGGGNSLYGGGNPGNPADVATKVKTYSSQVAKMWGESFGNSPILTDYFTELKTKD